MSPVSDVWLDRAAASSFIKVCVVLIWQVRDLSKDEVGNLVCLHLKTALDQSTSSALEALLVKLMNNSSDSQREAALQSIVPLLTEERHTRALRDCAIAVP